MENREKLRQLRGEIDGINKRMLELFVRRMKVSGEISKVKKELGMPTLDANREDIILNRVAEDTEEQYREYAKKLFRTLMDLSKEYQETLKDEKKD